MHSATKETPNSRLQHMHPEHPRVCPDPLLLDLAFLVKEERSVSATGTISVQGGDYEVDAALARRRVIIRFDPYDLTRIHIEHDGKDFGLALSVDLSRGQKAENVPPAPPAEERTPFHELMQQHDEQVCRRAAGHLHFTRGSQDGQPVEVRK